MSRHLKSYAAPKSWTILRKVTKWIIRPNAGAHPLKRALPLGLLLKQLGFAQTSREAKIILNMKNVLVDGRVIKETHFGTGFMDTIQIKPKTALRCSIDQKGRLRFIDIPDTDLNKKICKIIGKITIRGGKIQLNLSDGRNILIDKDKYVVGDSLLLEVPSQKITDHFPIEKENTAFLIGGRHTGKIGIIDDVQGQRVWCTSGKEKIETLKDLTYVIGKNKPAVKI